MTIREEKVSVLPIRAVIFDMDGLLVDTEPVWKSVELEVFRESGFDIAPHMGLGHTKGLRVDAATRHFAACVGAHELDIEKTVTVIVERIIDAVWNDVDLLPGSLSALELCADLGLALALASGSVRSIVDAVVERFELGHWFSVVATAEDDLYGKPNPEIFLRTSSLLGVPPEECLVVEDSINGCIAACAARMKLIAVPDERSIDDPRFSIADMRLSSLEQFNADVLAALSSQAEQPIS